MQCFLEIEHLRYRWGLLHLPSSEGIRQSRDLCLEARVVARRADRKNFSFSLNRGKLQPQVKTTPAQWITQPAFFVGTQDNKGNLQRLDGAELRDCNLPGA